MNIVLIFYSSGKIVLKLKKLKYEVNKMDYNKKRVEHWFYMLAYTVSGLFILAIMARLSIAFKYI